MWIPKGGALIWGPSLIKVNTVEKNYEIDGGQKISHILILWVSVSRNWEAVPLRFTIKNSSGNIVQFKGKHLKLSPIFDKFAGLGLQIYQK